MSVAAMCVRSPNEYWRQMKEKDQIYQCFVDMDPFICKNLTIWNILLKAFLYGQAVSIYIFFFYIANIPAFFIRFSGVLLCVASEFLHTASQFSSIKKPVEESIC